MERRPRPAPEPGTFTVEATSGLRAVAAHADPILLGYFPTYLRNPYQPLLYSAAWGEGFAPVRMPRWTQFPELVALQSAGLHTVLHLHWLTSVLRDATSDAEARQLGDAFVADLDRYRDVGGRIVWTIHNILPHDTPFEAAEAVLSEAVARRAEVLHVLTASTAELVAPHYRLARELVVHVPHPSYRGAYPDHVSREDARHELGLGVDEFVVVAMGDIRPYKGLDELLDAWELVPADRPRRLVIAGMPGRDAGIGPLIERAAVDPRVLIDARFVPSDEVQVVLRAGDVAVLPYRRALNSGALMLALTFGLPVIVPEGGGLADAIEPSFARTFRPGDRASLVDALTGAPELATGAAGQAALAAARTLDPREVSERFARELRGRLGG
jgi:beta-1,4-mannosyltransferase